jgi:hypothetical protein
MLTLGIMVARILGSQLHGLQRLSAYFQIVNYALVIIIAISGLFAAIRRSLRIAQLFTGLLIVQLPFGIVAGALAMRMIFKGVEEASSATVVAGTTFADVCSASLEGLSFLCQWVQIVKPIVVVSYLEFWIWEFFSIYAGVVYCHQLSSMGDIKILEEEDA